MKRKLLPLLFLLVAWHPSHAVALDDAAPPVVDRPETPPDTYVPLVQNYLSFTLEWLRMDYLYNPDAKASGPLHSVKKFDWHSLLRSNVVITYAIRLNQSRWAFCPGIGWSTLYYAFSGTEDKGGDNGKTYPRLKRESELKTASKNMHNKPGRTLLGAAIRIPFFDFFLRLRFNSILDDSKAGFHTWLGVKLGLRQRASMIINYSEYNDSGASSIHGGHFNLKSHAFGLQAGIGYGRFGLTGGFHLTPLFEKNQGPSSFDSRRPFSFGMYIDLL